MSTESDYPAARSWRFPGGLPGILAGILAGVVIGFAIRGSLGGPKPERVVVHDSMPTARDLSDLHAKSSFVLSPQDKATTGSPPPLPAPKPPTAKPEQKDPKAKPTDPSASPDKSKPPAEKDAKDKASPPKLLGSLPPLRPDLGNTLTPTVDLHAAEAKVRELVLQAAGKVLSAKNSSGGGGAMARTLEILVAEEKAARLASDIRSSLGTSALVGEPETSTKSDSTSTELKFIELTREETVLDQVKKKVDQARMDFYADAPALKTLESQYADQLKQVERLRRELHPPVKMSVVLHSGG